MRYFSALLAFLVMFTIVFVLVGLFIHPFVPPLPSRPVSAFEGEYWITNWVGAIAGILLGTYSARRTLTWEARKSKGSNS